MLNLMPRGNVNVLKNSPELTSRRLLKSVQYVSVFILEEVHPDAEQLPDTQRTALGGPIKVCEAMSEALHPHPA
jgi:hypothetical protein